MRKFFVVIFQILILVNILNAGALGFNKTLQGDTQRDVGEIITYRFDLSCNSQTDDCGDLTITDSLPSGMVIENCSAPHGFSISCESDGSSFTITKDDTFTSGDTFQLRVNAKINLDATPGSNLTNTATATIDLNNESKDASADSITVKKPKVNYSLFKKRIIPSTDLNIHMMHQ